MRSVSPLSCLGDISLRYFGKTGPFAFVAASLCTAVVAWTLAMQPCKGGAAPVEDITRPDAAEQATKPDTSDEGGVRLCSIVSDVLLIAGATCGFVAVALGVLRLM